VRGAASLDEALLLCRQGRLAEARKMLERLVAATPRHAEALHLLGLVHGRLGRHRDAVAALRKAVDLAPMNVEAALQLGDCAVQAGDTDTATAAYDRVARLAPNDPRPHYNMGVALMRAGRSDAAAASFEQALAIEPTLAQAHSALGSLRIDAGDAPGAVALHRRALEIDAVHPEFHNNLGVALDKLQRHEQALASFDRALALAPSYVEAWSNRGIALHELQRLDMALASFDRAIALDASDADAWSNRGLVLQDMHRLDDALRSHERATSLRPGDAQAWVRRAGTENAMKRHVAALAALDKALSIDANVAEALGARLHTAMLLCDWRGHAESLDRLRRTADSGAALIHPFAVLATPLGPEQQRRIAERYAAAMAPPTDDVAPAWPADGTRIRIGYFSADFRDHPMMVLMAEQFELHDRSRFEVVAFSFGAASESAQRQRAVAAFDRFIDVGDRSDADIAALSRSLHIDIAVDLMGYTEHARPGIFARRAAAVQVNMLGFAGTLGAPWMDYLIADAVVVPEPARHHYSEQVVTMPHSYMPNGAWQAPPAATVQRSDAGLPDGGFVFCCFNNSWKITPDVFDAWMRVLGRAPGSVLWLLQTNDVAKANLLREAQARGIDAGRLVFARRAGREQHLQRHGLADLFLDTFHYGAHTTASDALRMGLPVLTRTGETFASRVATSSNAATGMAELAVADAPAYESLAVELATMPSLFAATKSRLAMQLPGARLFDVRHYTRDLERAFVAMHERHRAGLAPEAITLAAGDE